MAIAVLRGALRINAPFWEASVRQASVLGVHSVFPATATSSLHCFSSSALDHRHVATIDGAVIGDVSHISSPGGRLKWSGKLVFELPFAARGFATTNTESPKVAAAEEAVQIAEDETKDRIVQSGSSLVQSAYWGLTPKKHFREDGTDWPWHSFRPGDAYMADVGIDLKKHWKFENMGDRFAFYLVKSLRLPTDIFFRRRYGCRAMMLETVAAVPGMVGGMLRHLQSLRRFERTGGWIRVLLEEAENERMHLMTFMDLVQPRWYERALVLAVQGVFFNAYFLAYLISPRVAHRVVGYLEEEAIHSYTEFIKEIDAGRIENVAAPLIAIDYWRLPPDATLRDVCVVVRADEAHHRDVNHFAANVVASGKDLKDHPAPVGYH